MLHIATNGQTLLLPTKIGWTVDTKPLVNDIGQNHAPRTLLPYYSKRTMLSTSPPLAISALKYIITHLHTYERERERERSVHVVIILADKYYQPPYV